MKNALSFLMPSVLLMALISCASVPVDRGTYNPNNAAENDLVTLYIDGCIDVAEMDNEPVSWWIQNGNNYQEQMVRIPKGVHSFLARYHDGTRFTLTSLTVTGQFTTGNSYLLKGVITGPIVVMQIVQYNDGIIGDDVTLDLNKLAGNDPGALSTYIRYVLNPTMDGTDNSVKLENDEYLLIYKPDLVYTLTNKLTGIITEGRHGFSIDFSMTSGKTFLLETDISQMSSEQFLSSDYEQTAQIILVPIACDGASVTYRYEKPESLNGTEVTFSITEID
ncbi:MAG: hypothetical protein LBQ88_14700 [Treponema sp.]|jgi:hypothetical protein|nr:hypothetical protein [Treponema sp.]